MNEDSVKGVGVAVPADGPSVGHAESDVSSTLTGEAPEGPITFTPTNGEAPPQHLLGRDEILSADDKRFEYVEVPEWGEGAAVRIRSLSANERDEFEAGFVDNTMHRNRKGRLQPSRDLRIKEVRARLCALTIVDDSGKLVFSLDDVKRLGGKSAAALDRIATAARELSGMTEEDEEELIEDQREDPTSGSGNG